MPEEKVKKTKTEEIREHYKKEARKFGDSKQSTMRDNNIRDMEIEQIIKYITVLNRGCNNPKVLEIGCGNGYTAEQIIKNLDINLECIDTCEDFIKTAKKRNINVKFNRGDILNLTNYKDNSFDIVFTERCLINLPSWNKQKQALNEIHRVLKTGRFYLMIECFTDGLQNLNDARKSVGLDPIKQPFHNLFFDKGKFSKFMKGRFTEFTLPYYYDKNFLSSYYFGSRVLYPALSKKIVYNNKFVEFFRFIQPYGNYSHLQLHLFKKRRVFNLTSSWKK